MLQVGGAKKWWKELFWTCWRSFQWVYWYWMGQSLLQSWKSTIYGLQWCLHSGLRGIYGRISRILKHTHLANVWPLLIIDKKTWPPTHMDKHLSATDTHGLDMYSDHFVGVCLLFVCSSEIFVDKCIWYLAHVCIAVGTRWYWQTTEQKIMGPKDLFYLLYYRFLYHKSRL